MLSSLVSLVSVRQDLRTYMLHDILGFPCNEFHFEETELTVNHVEFIDDCSDSFIFLSFNV